MDQEMQDILPEVGGIPTGARYVDLDALLQAETPSPDFLSRHNPQRPDRLWELCQLLQLKEEQERRATAAQGLMMLMQQEATKVVKHEHTEAQQKAIRAAAGTSPTSERNAAIKTIATYLATQTLPQLRDLMNVAGIRANLLSRETALKVKMLQDLNKEGTKHDVEKWDTETFERLQLHFFLGRALTETWDQTLKTNKPSYGGAMYQILFLGKDVNAHSRLATAMSEVKDCGLPGRTGDVAYNATPIRELLRAVHHFEMKASNGQGLVLIKKDGQAKEDAEPELVIPLVPLTAPPWLLTPPKSEKGARAKKAK